MSNTPRKRLMNLLIMLGCTVVLIILLIICYPEKPAEPPSVEQKSEALVEPTEPVEDPNLIDDPILFPEVTYVQYYTIEEFK